jgi:hypothetical protein
MKNLEKIAALLGEGFFADKVVSTDVNTSEEYGKEYYMDVLLAKISMDKNKSVDLDKLHRLVRFYSWFLERFGSVKVKSKKEAVNFFYNKLEELRDVKSKNRLDFFKWLQQKTLNETSELMYG